ncbi:hypothetical protein GCM10027612_60440 [Microbispora bryophytorum subsp. camponoti]
MPICTAVLAAALLSGPVSADPAPLSAKEPMSPGKQIAAMAMNHPEEPDIVASNALDILDKGTKVGPYMPADDEAEDQANGPMANGQSPQGSMTGRQAPGGDTADSRQAGQQPAGGPSEATPRRHPDEREPGERIAAGLHVHDARHRKEQQPGRAAGRLPSPDVQPADVHQDVRQRLHG